MKQSKLDFLALFMGNILEHYDKALYGLLAPYIAKLFFPGCTTLGSLAFFFLPMSLFAKPLGALLFGRFGDRYGIRKALIVSIIGISIATCGIGLLPTYQTLGIMAPILLYALRALMDFCSSGERTAAALSLLEKVEPKHRGFMSSLYQASAMVGCIIASLAITILHHYGKVELAWRYLFISGLLTGVCALYLRLQYKETSFGKVSLIHLKEALNASMLPFITVAVMVGFSYANYEIVMQMMHSLFMTNPSLKQHAILANTTLMLFWDMLLFPVFGLLSKKIPPEKLMKISLSLVVIFAVPLFLLLKNPTLTHVVLTRSVLIFLGVAHAATLQFWITSIIPKDRRYTLIALGKALGAGLIGNPSVSLSFFLYEKTGWIGVPGLYIAMTAGACLLCLRLLERRRKSIAIMV